MGHADSPIIYKDIRTCTRGIASRLNPLAAYPSASQPAARSTQDPFPLSSERTNSGPLMRSANCQCQGAVSAILGRRNFVLDQTYRIIYRPSCRAPSLCAGSMSSHDGRDGVV